MPSPRRRTDAFGDAIHAVRGRRSLQAVAARLTAFGVRTEKTQLSKYESGRVERPDFLLVWVFARLYRASLDVLGEALFLDRARPVDGSTSEALLHLRRIPGYLSQFSERPTSSDEQAHQEEEEPMRDDPQWFKDLVGTMRMAVRSEQESLVVAEQVWEWRKHREMSGPLAQERDA